MTHADAFLHDILAHPDDDAPRLIFADWLEEQGDASGVARAEFIRIQCALAAGNLTEQRRVLIKKRQKLFLKEYGSDWARPIRRLVEIWVFHRGFIDTVQMRADEFPAHASQLFCRTPIQHLCLFVYGNDLLSMAVLADFRELRNLRSLNLSCNRLESRDLRALLVSEHLTSLTALDLSHNRIGDSGIRALAESPLLGRLERLSLQGNDIGSSGLRAIAGALEALAHSPDELRLRRLELSDDNLSSAGQRVIADSPLLRRLVRWCY